MVDLNMYFLQERKLVTPENYVVFEDILLTGQVGFCQGTGYDKKR